MVDEKEPAEEGGKGDAGIFGPLITVIHEARKVHPAAGFLFFLLAILAIAIFAFPQVSSFVGGGWANIVRFVFYTVLLAIFLLLIVAFFAELIMPSENRKKGTQLGRGLGILIMTVLGSGAALTAEKSPRLCSYLLDAKSCAGEKVAAPKTIPTIGGLVTNGKEADQPISGLSVEIFSFGEDKIDAKVTGGKLFFSPLPETMSEGDTAYVTIRAPGFKTISNSEVKLKPSSKQKNLTLFHTTLLPVGSAGTSTIKPNFQIPINLKKSLERQAANVTQLPKFTPVAPGKVVTANTGKNDAAPTKTTDTSTAAEEARKAAAEAERKKRAREAEAAAAKAKTWSMSYWIFYCQDSLGNRRQSAALARKIASALTSRYKVERIRMTQEKRGEWRLRAPPGSGSSVYVSYNYRDYRSIYSEVVSALKPYGTIGSGAYVSPSKSTIYILACSK